MNETIVPSAHPVILPVERALDGGGNRLISTLSGLTNPTPVLPAGPSPAAAETRKASELEPVWKVRWGIRMSPWKELVESVCAHIDANVNNMAPLIIIRKSSK
jgi:hypothetical protein